MKLTRLIQSKIFTILLISATHVVAGDYEAPRAAKAPDIDGIGNDACWQSSSWYNIDQTWEGKVPGNTDFSGKFKFAWDEGKLYLLGEITDDSLSDVYTDPLTNYWDDDAFEIFIDEDKSGGEHEFSHNAFAYHVSKYLDVADIDADRGKKLFNDHVQAKWTKNGNVYTWECAITVFTDAFVFGSTNNEVASLSAGKIMGFALAYCDNDGGQMRDSFIGSEEVAGTNKNVGYKDASVFGSLTLKETLDPMAIIEPSSLAGRLESLASQNNGTLLITYYNMTGNVVQQSETNTDDLEGVLMQAPAGINVIQVSQNGIPLYIGKRFTLK